MDEHPSWHYGKRVFWRFFRYALWNLYYWNDKNKQSYSKISSSQPNYSFWWKSLVCTTNGWKYILIGNRWTSDIVIDMNLLFNKDKFCFSKSMCPQIWIWIFETTHSHWTFISQKADALWRFLEVSRVKEQLLCRQASKVQIVN